MLNLDYDKVIEAYGGNIPRIVQAAATGALGPNGLVLGMAAVNKIKTIRAAAATENMPQTTVAQDLGFGPPPQGAVPPQGGMPPGAPPAPAGLGATPEAAAMPQMAMAPSGPPMGGGAPAVGMADGGMVGGGLTSLPLPDDMFDEPNNGGYANGGLVSFAGAGPVTDDTANLPDTFYGYNWRDPLANAEARDTLFGKMQTAYQDAAEQDYLRRQGEDYKKAERKRSMGQLMAEAGFGMAAGQSPYFFQNLAAAALPAISSAATREKERKTEEREIQRGLMDIEQGRNTAAAARAAQLLEMQKTGITGMEAALGRQEAQKDRDLQRWETMYREGAETNRAAMRANYGDGEPKVNMADDTLVIPGANKRDPGVRIPRMRVTERGTGRYGYTFPELGDAVINPAHGSYAMGVRNVILYAQRNGLGLGVSTTGRLQLIGKDRKPRTISDTRLRQFDNAGPRIDFNKFK